MADSIPVLGCDGVGCKVSIWPPESSLKWNFFTGCQDLESWKRGAGEGAGAGDEIRSKSGAHKPVVVDGICNGSKQ